VPTTKAPGQPAVQSEMEEKMTVTIRDVARHAGTSIATVSNVLNSTGRITDETRRRVLASIKKLKYHPNLHARNLALGTSRTLGIIVSDIENPFFPAVVRAFEIRARHRGYDVIVSDTNYDPSLMKRATERMLEQKVTGVAIMTSEMSPRRVHEIIERDIAVTFFDAGLPRERTSCIKMDYRSGIRAAMDHLYRFGHRRIAFVAGRSVFRNIKARQVAYVDCMRYLGLDPGPVIHGNQRFDGGLSAGVTIAGMKPRPTAVIAMNDLTAVGVIKALHREGLRVPQDVSVVGFDRTQLAECLTPSLTTVDMHPDLLGQTAADALHALCSSAKGEGKEYFMPLELVVGESTGPVPETSGP
jgi:DNA-binding LacI/PurR family transcriptional regulator